MKKVSVLVSILLTGFLGVAAASAQTEVDAASADATFPWAGRFDRCTSSDELRRLVTIPPGPQRLAAETGDRRCSRTDGTNNSRTDVPFAHVGGINLHLPSTGVEFVGFHESTNPQAQPIVALGDVTAPILTMPTRRRGTDPRSAADIAIRSGWDVRSPVSGTVMRAGGYTLYCRYQDDFVVIAPDAAPGWEVKVLHLNGVAVSPGASVDAGVTVIAPAASVFPFRSQIDAYTSEPSPGHVHIEVLDPAIPRPPAAGC